MSENNYAPNSHKSREEANEIEKKKVEKVVKGNVKVKKKNEISKFADVFISEDAANVKNFIVSDVLIPAVKKVISDIVTNGIDMILYGSNGRGAKRSTNASYVSYNRFSDKREEPRPSSNSHSRTSFGYEGIVLDSRSEAIEVLTRMDELIREYEIVTVSDLCDLVGISSNYTDQKYGWTSIRTAEPVRVRDGYILKLPKPLPID